MDSSETVDLHYLIENIDSQMVRGLTLPPLKVSMIDNESKDFRARFETEIRKKVQSLSPLSWLKLPFDKPVLHQRLALEVAPPRNSEAWTQPLVTELDVFSYSLSSEYQTIYAPAARISLVAREKDLSEQFCRDQILAKLERVLERTKLHDWLRRLVHREFLLQKVEIPIEKSSRRRKRSKKTKTLSQVATRIDSASGEGAFILERQSITDRIVDLLGTESRASVLLVGPPGVGKTAILRRAVFEQSDQPQFRNVWSTTGSRIVSGMSGLGMWQRRVLDMLKELKDVGGILHVGSLVEVMEAGKIQGQPGVSAMLRQSIAQGSLQVVAEVTPEQIAVVEREDPMLLRGFVRCEVMQPDSTELKRILTAASDRIVDEAAQFNRKRKKTPANPPLRLATVTPDAIDELEHLFRRFSTYSALPAPALRLLRSILDAANADETIDSRRVAAAFAEQTGLPLFLLDDSQTLDLASMQADLASQIIGQPEPIDIIVNLMAAFRARLVRSDRPLASLLFVGPTGVGKTEMAKAIARIMYNDPNRMIRIDMSEYSNPWSAVRLIGRPGEGDGTLVSPIREQPFSVVLLDEFEKADPAVFDILLQVLGEGRLTDSRGSLADFRNAIVIMTSNLGVDTFRPQQFGFGDTDDYSGYRDHFVKSVRQFIRPELLGRLDRIVAFAPLEKSVVRDIARRELSKIEHRPGLRTNGISFHFDDAVVDRIAEIGYEPRFGARPVRRAIENNIIMPMATALLDLPTYAVHTCHVRCDGNEITVHLEKKEINDTYDSFESLNATPIETPDRKRKIRLQSTLNHWRSLRLKGAALQNCSEFQELENSIEQFLQKISRGEEGLTTARSANQTSSLRSEIGGYQAQLKSLTTFQSELIEATEAINAYHHQSMMQWYAHRSLDVEQLEFDGANHDERLKHLALVLLGKQLQTASVTTITLLGQNLSDAHQLLRAYANIAESKDWQRQFYLLADHVPKPNQKPPPKSGDASPGSPIIASWKPLASLAHEDDPSPEIRSEPAIDIYNLPDDFQPSHAPPNTVGFSLTLYGDGVQSWLMSESGLHTFLHPSKRASSDRQHCLVLFQTGSTADFKLPHYWNSSHVSADVSPVRSYDFVNQVINDVESHTSTNFVKSNFQNQLVSLLTVQAEERIWKSIGYVPAPISARLGYAFDEYEIEVPF
jgi:ATP-dependent Clp protease ATP-binding subunit ClpA